MNFSTETVATRRYTKTGDLTSCKEADLTLLPLYSPVSYTHLCKIVIRHAAIDKILKLRRRWEREVSIDYLMNEKFVQLAEPEQIEEYLFTACGQTAVLYHAELAAALALLPEQTQEELFRYYFLRQPQRVIGVHIGRTRSTAGRHIQLALKRLRRLMAVSYTHLITVAEIISNHFFITNTSI